jgi:uncharacterized protein (DUF2147 family)
MINLFFLSVLTVTTALKATPLYNSDEIIGRWMSTKNNLAVEIFKTNNEYKAKVVWIDDSDDKNRPMNTRCDWKNPDENLRRRKIIGLVVMHGLVFNRANHDWEGGRIYDPNSGKDWNAKVWLTKDEHLKVRGYWDFQVLGKDILFKKVS